MAVDVAANTGTLLAVVAYFRRDLAAYVRALRPGRGPSDAERRRMIPLLAVASLPVLVVGVAASDWIAGDARSPGVIAWATIETHEECGVWVANCPALDIASQGKDPQDAVRMLKEAIDLVMEHCLEENSWMAFLEERGVTPTRQSIATSTEPRFDEERDYVEFPIWITSDAETSAPASGPWKHPMRA